MDDITTPVGGVITHTSTSSISAVADGVYWVEITDNGNPNNACVSQAAITIESDFEVISFDLATDVTVANVPDCNSSNSGVITITDVQITGGGVTTIDDFEIVLYNSSNAIAGTKVVNAGSNVTFSDLGQGSYFAQATLISSGCTSDLTEIKVNTTPVLPILSEAMTDNTACQLLLQTVQLRSHRSAS